MSDPRSKWMQRFFWGAVLALGMVGAAGALEIGIVVAPNVINIQSEGTVVTVHTDIGYGEVDVYSVYLNGVQIQTAKADNQGNFVAKFDMDAIKLLDGLVYGGLNTLKLVGLTRSGESFWGSDEVLVVNNEPAGGGR